MSKSANDMMTRPQLSGPHPTCVLSWSGDGSLQWGPVAKPRLGVCRDWGN